MFRCQIIDRLVSAVESTEGILDRFWAVIRKLDLGRGTVSLAECFTLLEIGVQHGLENWRGLAEQMRRDLDLFLLGTNEEHDIAIGDELPQRGFSGFWVIISAGRPRTNTQESHWSFRVYGLSGRLW